MAVGRKLTYLILLLFLVADLSYSFLQFYHQPLDGDMGWNIVPAESVEPIFENPFGLKAVIEDVYYPNPNRYFAQLGYREYMLGVPPLLQSASSPIESVYLSCAIAKTLSQALLIFLLAMLITGSVNLLKVEVVSAAAIVIPLFQTNGYHHSMGIIDQATTYTFFYALSVVPVLLLFLTLVRRYFHESVPTITRWKIILLIPISLIIALSGPLNTGIILVTFTVLFTGYFIRGLKSVNVGNFVTRGFKLIPKGIIFVGIPASLFALYSLFIGTYNSISVVSDADIWSRYALLPEGLWNLISQKIGLPLLLLFVIFNCSVIKRTSPSHKIMRALPWLGAFILVYILLLPLGGFRDYRPLILRYDTIMPVMLVLFFLFGITSLHLIRSLKHQFRTSYLIAVLGLCTFFTIADEPEFDNNKCEKLGLQELVITTEQTVVLQADCPVMGWTTFNSLEESKWNSKLLVSWGILDHEKRYRHSNP